MLALALIPIFGALVGALVYRTSEQQASEALVPQREAVEISWAMIRFNDDFQSAVLSIEQAAQEPGRTDRIAAAERRKADALANIEQTIPRVDSFAEAIGNGLGIDPDSFQGIILDALQRAELVLEAQPVGEPLTPELAMQSQMIGLSFQGRQFAGPGSASIRLTTEKNVLYRLFDFQDETADAIRRGTTEFAATDFTALREPGEAPGIPDFVQPPAPPSDPGSGRAWVELQTAFDLVSGREEFALHGLGTSPIEADLVEPGPDFFSDAIATRDMIRGDTERSYARTIAVIDELDDAISHRQQLATYLGAGMVGLTIALLGLQLLEIRDRRRVERAHTQALDKLGEKARTDPLTGAWNRRWIDDVLRQRLDGQDSLGHVLLAYVDIDRFKAVNDLWGHDVGDQLLTEITSRLQTASFPHGDVEVVRFGGDEFVCFTSVVGPKPITLQSFGGALLEALNRPIGAGSQEYAVRATIGLTQSTATSTAHSLILEADTALMQAKKTQRGTAAVYNRAVSQTGELLRKLPAALEDGEVAAVVQPVHDLSTGYVVHVEALARWITPDGETINPVDFVPVVEAFGLANQLTQAILRSVGSHVANDSIPGGLRVWVNVAPVELEAHDFAERFLAAVAENGLSGRIGVEITETAAIADPIHFAECAEQLRAGGVPIALDDFGSGYSPLGLLQDLPVDVVKLDRSIIAHIDTNFGHQSLVDGIIGLLAVQKRMIIAEGIERSEEREWLSAHGVQIGQGFGLTRPSAPELIDWQSTLMNADSPVDVDSRMDASAP